MYEKATYNILVTDYSMLESLASRFIHEGHNRAGATTSFRKDVKWIKPPKWAAERSHIPLSFFRYELEKLCLDLYSFPSAIGRDFLLDDLDINFDGVLLIVDLGDKRFWDSRIKLAKSKDAGDEQPPKSKALMIRDRQFDNRLEAEPVFVPLIYRISAFGDPTRIWGVEMVNQIKGAKLVLAIRSSANCVPASYIREHLYLEPPIDIVEHTVNPDTWRDLYQSYSGEVIRDALSKLGQMAHLNGARSSSGK